MGTRYSMTRYNTMILHRVYCAAIRLNQGPDSMKRCCLTSIGIPIVGQDGRKFVLSPPIGIHILVRCHFLARWLTSARAYRIGGRKLCPSVCLYVKRYLLLQFCTDYNQTWINMIGAEAAKTWLSQIFHKWRQIEVNCVYISRCAQLVSYFWNAGMHTK